MKAAKREVIFSKINIIITDFLIKHGYEVQEKKCYLYGKKTDKSDIPIDSIKDELYKTISAELNIKLPKVLNLCRITAYDNSCYICFKKEVE